MSLPRAEQQPCHHVPGKQQNCGNFGTFIDKSFRELAKAMCHGGVYMGKVYSPCPVAEECYRATAGARRRALPELELNPKPKEVLVTPPPKMAPTIDLSNIEIPKLNFSLGDFGLPVMTNIPVATEPQPKAVATKAMEEKIKATITEILNGGDHRQVAQPTKDALPGMRTPFLADTNPINPPTFLPRESESTWDRLLKNIIQGIIAAIGFAIWQFARTIDLFG